MSSFVRCTNCVHTRVDEKASDKNWKAIECGNRDSVHYRDLLNIGENGDKKAAIWWSGCFVGVKKSYFIQSTKLSDSTSTAAD